MLTSNSETVYTYVRSEDVEQIVKNLPVMAPMIFKRDGSVKSPLRRNIIKRDFTQNMDMFFSSRRFVQMDVRDGVEPKMCIRCNGMTLTFTGPVAEFLAWDDEYQYLSKLIGAGWDISTC